jgi:hypothetical protein
VVIEPFFESAAPEQEAAPLRVGPLSTREPPRVDKPLHARVPALAYEHRRVLEEVRRLRPSWRVHSTASLAELRGDVSLVRVVVGNTVTIASNRTEKNMAFAFGIVIPPLQLFHLEPVKETRRVYGTVNRFIADAQTLAPRRIRYPTQPDFAVDTRGLRGWTQPFGLDVSIEEGVLGTEEKRDAALLEGFSRALAVAVVAIVEEADAQIPQ